MGTSFFKSNSIRITPLQLVFVIALIAFTSFAISFGIRIRIDAFNWSDGIHHEDLIGAYRRGTIIADEGVLSIYDHIADPSSSLESAGIDYAPLRVAVIGQWVKWYQQTHSNERWTMTYDSTWPLLATNTIAELSSAILVFLLIHHWLNRTRPVDTTWTFGIITALIGATLFGFNPALIWNAHCWPQWDAWLIPFFLAAVYLSSKNCWFSAGFSIAIGTFFKGQILLVAPLLLLWPIFQIRWREPIRILSGFFTAALFIAMPWMVGTTTGATVEIIYLAIMIFLTIANRLRPRFFSKLDWFSINSLIFSLLLFVILPHLGGSMNWYTVGFEFGTHKFPNLASAVGTFSIPTLLRDYFHYPDDMDTPISIIGYEMSIRHLMFALYAICLIVCAGSAARLEKKNHPAFLLTIITPWICFFMLLTQMNNRYLIWGAVFAGSISIAGSRGLTLLGLLLSAICISGMAQHMVPVDWDYSPQFGRAVHAMQTHLAWPVALIGLIFLYQTASAAIKSPKASENPQGSTQNL